MFRLTRRHRTFWIVIGTALVTLVAVLVGANFMSGEKKIERRIERLNSLDDARFADELGVLLGPPFLPGNRHQVLRNAR